MQIRWLKHLPTGDHEDFKKRLLSVQDVLEVLDNILLGFQNGVEIARMPDYESASWAYKQADINGYIRAIQEVRKLIDLDEPKR